MTMTIVAANPRSQVVPWVHSSLAELVEIIEDEDTPAGASEHVTQAQRLCKAVDAVGGAEEMVAESNRLVARALRRVAQLGWKDDKWDAAVQMSPHHKGAAVALARVPDDEWPSLLEGITSKVTAFTRSKQLRQWAATKQELAATRRRLHIAVQGGASWADAAAEEGMSVPAARGLADLAWQQARDEASRRLKRYRHEDETRDLARRRGGSVAVAYAAIRKALALIDAVAPDAEDDIERMHMHDAYVFISHAEDAVSRALRGSPERSPSVHTS